jgi:hypothetical protein
VGISYIKCFPCRVLKSSGVRQNAVKGLLSNSLVTNWVAGGSSSMYHDLCLLSSVRCNVDECGSVGANVMNVMLLM